MVHGFITVIFLYLGVALSRAQGILLQEVLSTEHLIACFVKFLGIYLCLCCNHFMLNHKVSEDTGNTGLLSNNTKHDILLVSKTCVYCLVFSI